jgi:hypothetical protein
MQLAAAFVANRTVRFDGQYLWPFLDYAMYTTAYRVGDRIHRYHVFAGFDDGSELELHPPMLGMNFFHFRIRVSEPIRDGRHELLRPLPDEIERRLGRRPVVLRLEDHPLVLRRDGADHLPIERLGAVTAAELEAGP